MLEAKAKAAVILIRLDPNLIKVQKARDWGVDGVVAYSKICTHVGCAVGLSTSSRPITCSAPATSRRST